MKDKNYIECGKIINTHGCKGGLKLESWCNTPEDLAGMKKIFMLESGAYKKYKVKKASVFKQFVLFDLDTIDDMDKALLLKNQVVYADRNDFDLEDDEYFIADVIGLDVIDYNTNKCYGKLSDIINRGASDIYVVKTENGEVMIPAVDEFIKKVDIKNNIILITPIQGMFD
jgi:16S rRNA processing protein RimM